jgi:TonB family protein
MTTLTAHLLAFSLQLALITLAGTATAWVLRVRSPRLLLANDYAVLLAGVLGPWAMLLGPSADPTSAVLMTTVLTEAAQSGAARVGLGYGVLGAILLGGAAARFGWLAVGTVRLSQLRRQGEPLADSTGVIERLEREIGVRAEWVVCDGLSGPATYGVRRPIVLLPRGVVSAGLETLRMAACHELVHARRRDWAALVAEECLRAVLWFHPCVWLMLSRVHLHREQVVDHRVIAMLGDGPRYASALIDGVARGWTFQPGSIAPGWVKARHLRARVLSMRRGGTMSRSRWSVSVFALLGVLSVSAWWGSRAFPVQAAQNAGHRVYASDEGVVLPKLVSSVKAIYTKEAMAAKIQGEVLLNVVVGTDGTVSDIEVVKSLDTVYGLDDQAIDALRAWRFEPGTKDGAPVNVRVKIEMNFRLK